ncbi:MAG: F0F1 ATP synthase subunit A [Caldilineales bacterium]|nr:F0F1 ATP synthase subunit A [Caldilineales bacterium]
MRKLFQGTNLIILIGVLAALLASALLIKVPLPTILLPAEKIPGLSIAGFPITNTLITTLMADLTVLILGFLAVRKIKEVPQGLQNLVEWVFEAFNGMLTDIAGKQKARQWFPMFMTILLFLLFANWWELVPGFDSIGLIEPLEVAYHESGGTVATGYEKGTFLGLPSLVKKPVALTAEQKHKVEEEVLAAEAHGEAYHGPHDEHDASGGYVLLPFFRAAATDLNLPLALAIISVVMTQIVGMRMLGLKYWRRFINPVITGIKPIDIFVGVLEFVSEIAKIVSFSFRLFGNIFAGQVLLFVMPFLVALIVPVAFFGLELFVGFMQAFVFAILTFIFFEQGTHSHAGDEHH